MQTKFDETKLTAYALNELSPAEQVEVETYLAEHTDARKVLANIRATADYLTAELSQELTNAPLVAEGTVGTVMGDAPLSIQITRPRTVRYRWAIAASLMAAAGVGIYSIELHIQRARVEFVSSQIEQLRVLNPAPGILAASKPTTPEQSTFTGAVGGGATSSSGWKSNSPLPPDFSVATNPVAAQQTNNHARTDSEAQVAGLIKDSRDYIDQHKYKESLGVIGHIQAIDPNNKYASSVRMLLEDKANLQEQRAYSEKDDLEYTKQLNDGDPGVGANTATAQKIPAKHEASNATFRDAHGNVVPADGTGGSRTLDWQANVGNASVPASIAANPGDYPHPADIVANTSAKGTFQSNPFAEAQRDNVLTGRSSEKDAARSRVNDQSRNSDPSIATDTPQLPTGTNTESYAHPTDNSFLPALQNPLSTFSIDVDTASYANIRRFLTNNQLPPPDAVRIEEMVNYFPYDYPGPRAADESPVAVDVEMAGCPWEPEHRLARVALKAKVVAPQQRPACNIVFLIDVSGSMGDPNKLDLLKKALPLLVDKLTSDDHVSIVTYAGETGIALQRTSGADKPAILGAIGNLNANGSTNGGAGIMLAYSTAVSGFVKGGINRVILATDGDFNVGVTDQNDLTKLIEGKAKTGVYLTVLGVGMGNLKDATMEKLADHGHGNYAYLDTLEEAGKVLVRQMDSTLITVAKDVKVQVEFNPANVSSYRLIGYEDRAMAKEDFNNDKKDAGDMGAGHAVTALYEIVPTTIMLPPGVDALKYQRVPATTQPGNTEIMTVKVRYKLPDDQASRKLEVPVSDGGQTYANASSDFRFASSVASFGMILRQSPFKGNSTFDSVIESASAAKGEDAGGYRAEFIGLVKQAKRIAN